MGKDEEYLTEELTREFLEYLKDRGRSARSLATYRQILAGLNSYLPEPKRITAETCERWRSWLMGQGFAQRTVNNRVSVLNSLLEYLGHRDWQGKDLPAPEGDVQPELTRTEYLRLLSTARHLGRRRTYLLIKTLGSAGVRLQELPQLTVEAVGRGVVRLDGSGQQTRRVLRLPEVLREELAEYARGETIPAGPVFVTRTGRPLTRSAVLSSISALAEDARVDGEKATPRCLWKMYRGTRDGIEKNLAALAEQTYERMLEEEQLTVGWDR